jgi:hypothetical protein
MEINNYPICVKWFDSGGAFNSFVVPFIFWLHVGNLFKKFGD